MRIEWKWGLALAAVLAMAAPADGLAQRRHDDDDDDRKQRSRQIERREHPAERIHRGRIDDRDDRRPSRGRVVHRGAIPDGRIVLLDRRGRRVVLDEDVIVRRDRPRNGRGPAFCKSGAGHPVHGPAWCLEKGWGLGGRQIVFLDDRRVVFWNGRDATWVRNVRIDDRWSLWSGLLNGLLEVADFG
jgi:hypothetical protein